jgi:hypothetical protein
MIDKMSQTHFIYLSFVIVSNTTGMAHLKITGTLSSWKQAFTV